MKRRQFLETTAIGMALPWLESLAGAESAADLPRRMVCICSPLGIHGPNFFPRQSGQEYELPPYLELVKDYREQLTIVSGLSHPEVGPFHDSMNSFLTGAPHPEVRAGFRNTISLDQFAAESLRGQTRYSSLTLACEGAGLAWTRSGAPVPTEGSPSRLFRKLFVEGSPAEVQAERNRLRDGQSILDMLSSQRAAVSRKLGRNDAEKLDEYLSGVRDLEQQVVQAEAWARRPKPRVEAEPPQDITDPADIVQQDKLWYDLIHLALQTDSTRVITLTSSALTGVPLVNGVSMGYHDLSHHGQDETKLDQLRKVELAKMQAFAELLRKLHETKEGDRTLLDTTMVFFGSNLGNASSHDVKNLPVLLAGGGFQHGQHLAFDSTNGPPLCNLFVSMLQRLGLPADTFASSTGPLPGLECA